MCVSAPVSLATAAVLVPAGVFAVRRAREADRSYVPLALFPLAFGIQQTFEGAAWLALEVQNIGVLYAAAFGFLFFSHFFWPLWGPFSVYWAEVRPRRRRVLGVVAVIGGLFGASLYFPMLLNGWLEVGVARGSIRYDTGLVYDGLISRGLVRGFYALVVLPPFFISSRKDVRVFGGVLALSMLLAYLFYDHAFISVWCFFAAVISLLIVYLIYRKGAQAGQDGPA